MARRSTPGPYRMAWDREPAFRTFMNAVAGLDAEASRRASVLDSLRDRLLPLHRQLAPSPGGFHDAVHALLVGDPSAPPGEEAAGEAENPPRREAATDEPPRADGSPDRGHGGAEFDNELEPEATALVEAIWDWALNPFGLVVPIEQLHRLPSSQLEDFFAPEMAYHRDFLFCVYWTLLHMAETPNEGGPLRWVIHGEAGTGPTDPLVDDMRGTPDFVERRPTDQPEVFRVRHEDRDRYEITFRPEKWIPGGSESGPAAVARIVAEFKDRLERTLEAQARHQQQVGNLVPATKHLTPDRARVLALYQVHGETLVGAGRGHPDMAEQDDKQISDTVGIWVREAAEQLLGPNYTIWLRRPRKGFPKGRTRESRKV